MTASEPLLFGHGANAGIVAVEPDLAAGTVALYRRMGDSLERDVERLRSWVLARKTMDDSTELGGPHPLRHLLVTSGGRAIEFARSLASDQRLAYQDPVTAHLCLSGETFYRGMDFGELRRLQFDLETLDIYPDRESGAICLIAVTDNRGFERVLALDDFTSEAALIAEFVRVVHERDPDLIEGHNVFNFDLWYLWHRARRAGVPLLLGRDGTTPLYLDESLRRAVPNGMVAKYYRIEGRQIIDTFYGVMRWDVTRRLPNYKLKQVVHHLGIGDDKRTLVNAANMRALWADPAERAKLKAYCLDDARDTARLSALVTPSEFHQAQMVPESLQSLAFVGIGARIERLMVRAYLHARHSIPRPRTPMPIEGALTAAFEIGVFHDVVKCDVESLYPSLMLARAIAPVDDDLGVFTPMLRAMRDLRIAAKHAAANPDLGADSADAAGGLAQALKVLVNSFYGFLGTNGLHFNDPAAAARVTEAGREVMETIVAGLRSRNALVIEADTDGAFFTTPPDGDAHAIVREVGAALGDDVRLILEERYADMLSLMAKNYALRRSNGQMVLRGSALRSARDEAFGRTLVTEIAIALMDGHPERTLGLVLEAVDKARNGRLTIEEFSRRESITPKTFSSPGNRRLANALAERGLEVGDKVRVYQRAGGELTLAEEYAQDEDRDYLLRRIGDFVARFGDLVPSETKVAAAAHPDQMTLL